MKRALLVLALAIVAQYGFVHHKLTGNHSGVWSTKSTLFDGSNDNVSVPESSTRVDLSTTNFTFAAWIKPTALTDFGAIMCRWDGGGTIAHILATSSAGQLFGYFGGVANTASAVGAITVGAWHLVGFGVSGGTGTIYVDGVNAALGFEVTAGSTIGIGVPEIIGACASTGSPAWQFNGTIDEASYWWDIPLTPAMWAELYNAGKPKNLTTHSNYSKLVHWYRMGDGGSDSFPTLHDYGDYFTQADATCTNMTSAGVNFVSDAP